MKGLQDDAEDGVPGAGELAPHGRRHRTCLERLEDLATERLREVREREMLVTRGLRRLREVVGRELPIIEYPLEEIRKQKDER